MQAVFTCLMIGFFVVFSVAVFATRMEAEENKYNIGDK